MSGYCDPPKKSQFKKGQSGNPSGKPKGLLTADKIASLVTRLAQLDRASLNAITTNKKSTMIELAVAKILEQASDGDYASLEFLLARSIGKVKDSLEVTTVKPYIIHRPDGSALELGAAKPDVVEGEVEDE